jgi:aspartyl-tRNA synthetase
MQCRGASCACEATAPGIDRIVMLLCGEENLRVVVLFSMNQRGEDLMMGAPSPTWGVRVNYARFTRVKI